MISGLINVYKKRGMTSHDVVYHLRKIIGQKKIGHTGTLDPDAEGVLPVCLGAGTKLCELMGGGEKEYRAVLLLGVTTDTQDLSGTILARRTVTCSREEIIAAARSFLGEQMQIPPMYSAVKQNGKRLYELARKGIEVERRARPVLIHVFEVEQVALPEVTVRVTCSKGTYIRTLCNDLGEKLGCGGCVKSLVRLRSGLFGLEEAKTLEQIRALQEKGTLAQIVIPPDRFFPEAARATVARELTVRLQNGNPFFREQLILLDEEGKWTPALRLYDAEGTFIGVYKERKRGMYFPDRMFFPGS